MRGLPIIPPMVGSAGNPAQIKEFEMRMLSIVSAVALAAMLASPALAGGGWQCVEYDNVSYFGNASVHVSKTQTCRNLAGCPTPSQFASLSDPVAPTGRIDDPDTHQWEKVNRKGEVVWTSAEKAGACPL